MASARARSAASSASCASSIVVNVKTDAPVFRFINAAETPSSSSGWWYIGSRENRTTPLPRFTPANHSCFVAPGRRRKGWPYTSTGSRPSRYGSSNPWSRDSSAASSASVGGKLPDPGGDLLRADHEPLLQDVVVRDAGHVRSGDPGHRPVEVVERLLGDDRGHLRAVAAEPVVFVDDHALAGLADRVEDSLLVEGPERPEVDHLDADPVVGDPVRGLEGVMGHQAVGAHGDLGAGVGHLRLAEGHGELAVRDVAADAPVHLLVLEEEDRVLVADRAAEQALGVVGRGRDDDLQPRDVGEERLDRLAVVQRAMDTAAIGRPDDHRRAVAVV